MVNLKTQVGGIELKNPLILASANYSSSVNGLKRNIAMGYGAIVTKTVTTNPLQGAPKPTVFWYDPKEKNLLSGVEGLKNPGIDKMVEAIDQVIEISVEQNCKIIGSCTGNTIEEVLLICEKFKKAGVTGIELNMVCPNTGPHLGKEYNRIGKWWSRDAERAIKLIKGIKKQFELPVWAKLPLAKLVDNHFLQTLDQEGAPDAYSFVGGRLPNLKIDIKTGKPILPGNLLLMIKQKIPISPMVTGPVKPSTVLHVAYISKLTKTPLICSGGLTEGEDILETIMAGASAAQICKVVYREAKAGHRILEEIKELMEMNNYHNLEKIRGLTLQYLPDPPLFTVPNAKLY
ncbi:MAG: hypothetical protein DRH33_07530 [Candidatus Nealsonbacteria bacterium]|nr:MAG: hypothetical protein DRH33_07530 [Candidatus Nealsonbacteria bacterium]